MSVYKTTYIILGYSIPYDLGKDFSEKWHEEGLMLGYSDEDPDSCGILFDGFNGKYIIIGKCWAKRNEYEDFDPPFLLPCYSPGAEIEVKEFVKKHGLRDLVRGYGINQYVVDHFH